ncbi:FAD-binding oxidoreductase [Pararhodobacter oceanensis]|uniref:FAD-linked oxidase n=1 Tax=Pararhodobacter oceanensis TaxID=2172121 RepID=A0A2T8HXK9_9RHOB|nr:FAD-binding oxidoreductase [Pararhodobacter oceanensis]PVH30134.1 FAD-linked oxidase [Pararhodobacter oceanensis]
MQLSGWGRFPRVDTRLSSPRDERALAALIAEGPLIARGMGRAYGDSALAAHTVDMGRFNKMIGFDAASGQLVAEAGVTLGEVIAAFLPRGWFLSVTPGTQFVSLGGAIAADVHGKNHHSEGSFGTFVDWIDLMGGDGQVQRCSREENADLFHWTLGGMGLTGVILRAAIRLKPVESAYIRQRTIAAPDLDAALEAFEATYSATYSMAWIDCAATGAKLGHSIVMTGEHATRAELTPARRFHPYRTPAHGNLRVPFDFPGFALNPTSVRLFNEVYYRSNARKPELSTSAYGPFFYPLDSIRDWNRIYGRKGFMQFQCVVPLEAHAEGLRAILQAITRSGAGSFLAVLKRMGPQDSRLSFPMAGYTLALDFPMHQRSLDLLPELDRITLDHGGRFYLAKDSRMSAQTLRETDPRWAEFTTMRRDSGLAGRFASAQSERLGL